MPAKYVHHAVIGVHCFEAWK